MGEVILGDEVQDQVTGFKGVAVARHVYLNGCHRISVQPKVQKDGTLPETQTFDEPQLKVVQKKAAKAGSRNAGGPAPFGDRGRPMDRGR